MHIKNLLIFLLVLLTGTAAIAEESGGEYLPVRAGETVRFDGYLFSPEAIAKVITKSNKDLKTAKLECENKLELASIDMQRLNDLSAMESRVQTKLLNDTILAKDQIIEEKIKRIDHLEKKVNYNSYLIAGSFLAGSIVTFAVIHYTVGTVR